MHDKYLMNLPYGQIYKTCLIIFDPTFFLSVPAQIIDELSTDDVNVEEGDTVVLVCNVTGVPRPEVTWFRRPADSKFDQKERKGKCTARTLNQAGSGTTINSLCISPSLSISM